MPTSRRALCSLAALCLLAARVSGEPRQEAHYEGPLASFMIPTGAKVTDSTDVVADLALEIVAPAGSSLSSSSFRVLISKNKVNDADVEGLASAWRDARLRNRASWGVRAKGERRIEQSHLGSRRFLRFSDQMGSMLGSARQLMLCGAISARLICGVAHAPAEKEREAETMISRVLETFSLRKKG